MSLPFPTDPPGWFCAGVSAELAPGDLRPLRHSGRDLLLFRTERGIAVVTGAHCPHAFAYMGDGGWVQGETIVCPFHQWRYDADGICVNAPYRPGLPKPRLRAWPVVERGGRIFAWHDPAGGAPSSEPPMA
jgi:3-ketosteroid 9alpha-monooxygenase subunit A